jgi:heptosyltransferase-1
MPEILLVKTSSLGDLVHNLPVVCDIVSNVPGARIDWVVEESLATVPQLHPLVREVIPAAIRRWRGGIWQRNVWRDMRAFRQRLRAREYDAVIDSQGLVKSALVAWCARGCRYGLDYASAREPLAPFYDRTFSVPWSLHAVERNRSLAAQALGYDLAPQADYGIRAAALQHDVAYSPRYAVLLHATSAVRKLWREDLWARLGARLRDDGIDVLLPWGSALERSRSERLAGSIDGARVPPSLTLAQAAGLLAGAHVVIGVDTGLTHLAAALGVPVVGIYCATDPDATGIYAARRAINVGGIGQPPGIDAVMRAIQRVVAK